MMDVDFVQDYLIAHYAAVCGGAVSQNACTSSQ